MILDTKPILATSDVLTVLPGEGSGMLRLFLDARWLTPCTTAGKRPLYRADDVRACLDRLGRGELPRPVHVWRAALGQESAHLVDPRGRAVCGCREREWMPATTPRQCTRCQHHAKDLRVEPA